MIANVNSITSSTINYTTGCLNIKKEHGTITYYNISATIVSTLETVFFVANITDGNCMPNVIGCYFHPSARCPAKNASNTSPEFYLTSQNCSVSRTTLRKTSHVIYHVLDDLRYWTFYNISASACTRKGCGPFNSPYTIRTDEHAPTCSHNATAFHNTSSTSLFANWTEIPVNCAHGIVLYYNVFMSPAENYTGTECFNDSSCWANDTSGSIKFSTQVIQLNSEFTGLKKYKKYCLFLQAVNIKGRGPVSKGFCNYTAEDCKLKFPYFLFI